MTDARDGRVLCVACGAIVPHSGLNQDTMCLECRSYQQQMIIKRLNDSPEKQAERRKQYFKHLEIDKS